MSKMNMLDQCIDDVAKGDHDLKNKLINEISAHLNGALPFHELSYEAQYTIEVWETGNIEEQSYHDTVGYPGHDDDDIPLEEDV